MSISELLSIGQDEQSISRFLADALASKRDSIGSKHKEMNRDFSMFSFQSRTTQQQSSKAYLSTRNHSMVMSPSFHFGLQHSTRADQHKDQVRISRSALKHLVPRLMLSTPESQPPLTTHNDS